jgi:hypothetical protein
LQARADPQKPVDDLGARSDQVFAVVEEEQYVAATQVLNEGLGRRAIPAGYPKRRRDRLRYGGGIGHGRKLNQPDAAGEQVHVRMTHLQRQARFATAAGARQRHEATATHTLLELTQLACPSDKAGRRQRQVVSAACLGDRVISSTRLGRAH